LILISCLNFID